MGQLVKQLSYKHENLGLILSTFAKSQTQGHTLTLQHRQNSCRRISEVCGLASVAEYMNVRVANRTNQRKASEEDA